jgi:hypothetical protein
VHIPVLLPNESIDDGMATNLNLLLNISHTNRDTAQA